MKIIFALIGMLCLTSCQTQEIKDNRDPFVVVKQFLDLEQFDEAEKYLAENINKNAYWAMPTVMQSRICSEALNSCEKDLASMQAVLRCRREINIACPDSRPPISEKAQRRKSEQIEKNEAAEKRLSTSFKYEKQCKSGYKWGYEISSTLKSCVYCAFLLSVKMDKLTGEYTEKSDCEEARILSDEKSKFVHSGECFKRYLGENKFVTLWKSKVMYLVQPEMSNGKPDSFDLYFDSSEKCETAISNGIKYVTLNLTEIDVAPYGTAAKNRFITKCTKSEHPTCSKFKVGVEKLPEEIL